MSYLALYRKYRPQTFDEVVGQDSITRILKNQIKYKSRWSRVPVFRD